MMTANKQQDVKSLAALLDGLATIDQTLSISGVAIDSRQVQAGDLFMAYQGVDANGLDYIDAAIHSGAIVIAVDETARIDLGTIPVATVQIKNLRQRAGIIASRFYDEPSTAINMIGITGTNGKTTVSYMIAAVLSAFGHSAGLFGTLGYGRFGKIKPGQTTTPDPVTLQRLLSEWQTTGIETVAMEVSSHALAQHRVAGTEFDTAIWTNLSRDHLDYHSSFEDYKNTKFQLFESPTLQHAVVNIADPCGLELIARLPAGLQVIAYAIKQPQFAVQDFVSLVYVQQLQITPPMTSMIINSPWGQCELKTHLLGQFNLENLLASYAALAVLGFPIQDIALALADCNGVPGRMECFSAQDRPLLVVDYAHTPAALEQALLTLRPSCRGQLYCIFGCGGERDLGKRQQMGAIAERLADQVILTNDNPRCENPDKIIADIMEGIAVKTDIVINPDRADAIVNTMHNASADDVILIAGKGHETTQIIDNKILPFSDRELARRLTAGAQ